MWSSSSSHTMDDRSLETWCLRLLPTPHNSVGKPNHWLNPPPLYINNTLYVPLCVWAHDQPVSHIVKKVEIEIQNPWEERDTKVLLNDKASTDVLLSMWLQCPRFLAAPPPLALCSLALRLWFALKAREERGYCVCRRRRRRTSPTHKDEGPGVVTCEHERVWWHPCATTANQNPVRALWVRPRCCSNIRLWNLKTESCLQLKVSHTEIVIGCVNTILGSISIRLKGTRLHVKRNINWTVLRWANKTRQKHLSGLVNKVLSQVL